MLDFQFTLVLITLEYQQLTYKDTFTNYIF